MDGRLVALTFAVRLASEKCQQEKRKTVNGEDILFAMTSLGFENYGEALKIYLARYREVRETITFLTLYVKYSLTLQLRTWSPAANINVPDRLEQKVNQALPTTALTTPFLETLWILRLRVRPISLAILSRINQSTSGLLIPLVHTHQAWVVLLLSLCLCFAPISS